MGSDHCDAAKNMILFVNHFQKLIYSVLCALFLYSCALSPSHGEPGSLTKRPQPKISTIGLERQIHALINKERQRHGLTQLEWDNALAAIGRKHSQDMARRNFFDHYSPEGRDFLYRYRLQGYQCAIRINTTIHRGAENIALNNLYGSVTTVNGNSFYDWNSQEKIAETTVQGWMKSPGHRINILTPYWIREGIGVMIAPDDKVFITQNFC
jgi:uncharacterized protein YkwD